MIVKTLQVKPLLKTSELLVMCICSMYILGLRGKQNEYLIAFHGAEYAGEHNYSTLWERENVNSTDMYQHGDLFLSVSSLKQIPQIHTHTCSHTPSHADQNLHMCIQALKHTHKPNKRVCLYKQTDSGFIKVLTNPSLKSWSTLLVLFTWIC